MDSSNEVVRNFGFAGLGSRWSLQPRLNGAALLLLCAGMALPSASPLLAPIAVAQTAAAAAHQIGTVKAISGNTVTLATDAGQTYTVEVSDGARVLQIAPGSTDLKTAQVIALTDIAPGDRILVTGKAGDSANALTASRVILMKSTDIAHKHAAEEEDWQKRGSGGIVSAVDPATGTVTITARGKKVAVQTTSATLFRRYASDSVKFEDAQPGTLSQVRAGDQLRVRGTRSEDGSSIQAEEIVSGAFTNLSGTIASVDAAAGKLTLKDLATKKTYVIKVTSNSNLRTLPPDVAQRFAARARAGQGGQAGSGGHADSAAAPAAGAGQGHGSGSAGMDLSQMLGRLPTGSLQDLHPGEAVMLVASPSSAGDSLTAVTLLSGVEPILAATPGNSPAMTLSPWNVGGGEASEGAN
jgi:co-chaperonin GroES (HSP10)